MIFVMFQNPNLSVPELQQRLQAYVQMQMATQQQQQMFMQMRLQQVNPHSVYSPLSAVKIAFLLDPTTPPPLPIKLDFRPAHSI